MNFVSIKSSRVEFQRVEQKHNGVVHCEWQLLWKLLKEFHVWWKQMNMNIEMMQCKYLPWFFFSSQNFIGRQAVSIFCKRRMKNHFMCSKDYRCWSSEAVQMSCCVNGSDVSKSLSVLSDLSIHMCVRFSK